MINRGRLETGDFLFFIFFVSSRVYFVNAYICLNYRANGASSRFVSCCLPSETLGKIARRIFDTDFDIPLLQRRKKKFLRKLSSRPTEQDKFSYRSRIHVVTLSSPLLSSPRELFIRGLEITSNVLSVRRDRGGERGESDDSIPRPRGGAARALKITT